MALPARHQHQLCEQERQDEEERRRQIERNQPAIALLKSWLTDETESEEEQRRSLEWLMRALDEDRLSNRRHFLAEERIK